ncbi:MAG: Hsp20/alpha crystallin family protein [Candidatus Gastranaerophilales bacterium]|nr:Hsp20/alpha crystallin family protein [Candidatus Gastranaerophilales bacterium]
MRFLIKKTPDNFIKSVNDEIATILNRHFDNFYPGYDYDEMSDKQTMPLEIRDKKQEYDIRAELPGVKKEDLDIDLNDNYLTVRATKTQEKTEEDKSYSKSEFSYGEFSRTVYLPQEVDADKIDAKLEHGVLKLVIPKMQNNKETVKKITVK